PGDDRAVTNQDIPTGGAGQIARCVVDHRESRVGGAGGYLRGDMVGRWGSVNECGKVIKILRHGLQSRLARASAGCLLRWRSTNRSGAPSNSAPDGSSSGSISASAWRRLLRTRSWLGSYMSMT